MMTHAQHKLSRRALLAGVCAAPALVVAPAPAWGAPPVALPSPEDAARAAAWAKAVARLERAQGVLDALGATADEEAYDAAVGRQNAALARVLRAAAPDLAAVGAKIALIAAEQAWELSFGAAAFARLGADVRRLDGAAG
jgi:DNA-binding FrmR family transcriptional regulator